MSAMNSKGQAFEPFNLLLGAIFALVVLAIIISAIGYFGGLRLDVSSQKFYDGLANVVKQPNKETFVINNLYFEKDSEFSAKALSKQMGLDEECVQILDSDAPGFEVTDNTVRATSALSTNVYARCSTNVDGYVSDCPVSCEISFGREFDN